jgi:hypothetical protein
VVQTAAAPGWWQALTWGLVVVAGGYIALIGMRIWALAHEDTIANELVANPQSIDRAAVGRFVALLTSLDQYYSALLFVYLAAFMVWITTVGRVVTRLGHNRRTVMRHWTYIAWRVTLIPVILLAVVIRPDPLPSFDDPAAFRDAVVGINQTQIVYSLARLVTLGLFIAAVVVIWNRVRRPTRPIA